MERFLADYELNSSQGLKIDFINLQLRRIYDQLNGQKPDMYPELPLLIYQIQSVLPLVLEDATKWHEHCGDKSITCPSLYEKMIQDLEQECRCFIRTQQQLKIHVDELEQELES